MKSFLALVAAAFLGGGAALGVGTAIWDEGGTTTVINSPAASDSSLASQTETGSSDTSANIAGRIYKEAAPGVVQVTSNVVSENPVFGEPQQGQSLGSGFVIDKAGLHRHELPRRRGRRGSQVNFSGERQRQGDDRRSDPSTDLAVLQIDVPSRALTPLPLGNSDAVAGRRRRSSRSETRSASTAR